jgi:hypothetical protein
MEKGKDAGNGKQLPKQQFSTNQSGAIALDLPELGTEMCLWEQARQQGRGRN